MSPLIVVAAVFLFSAVSADRFPASFYLDFEVRNYTKLGSEGKLIEKQLRVSDNHFKPYNLSVTVKQSSDDQDSRLQVMLFVDDVENKQSLYSFGRASGRLSLLHRSTSPWGDYVVGWGWKTFTQDDKNAGPIQHLPRDIIIKKRKWYDSEEDLIKLRLEFNCCV